MRAAAVEMLKVAHVVMAMGLAGQAHAQSTTPPPLCPLSYVNLPPSLWDLAKVSPEERSCRCEGDNLKYGAAYGSNPYAANSTICWAAVHAGAIPPTGGEIRVVPAPKQEKFVGSTQNGRTSMNSPAPYDAYRIEATSVPLPLEVTQKCGTGRDAADQVAWCVGVVSSSDAFRRMWTEALDACAAGKRIPARLQDAYANSRINPDYAVTCEVTYAIAEKYKLASPTAIRAAIAADQATTGRRPPRDDEVIAAFNRKFRQELKCEDSSCGLPTGQEFPGMGRAQGAQDQVDRRIGGTLDTAGVSRQATGSIQLLQQLRVAPRGTKLQSCEESGDGYSCTYQAGIDCWVLGRYKMGIYDIDGPSATRQYCPPLVGARVRTSRFAWKNGALEMDDIVFPSLPAKPVR